MIASANIILESWRKNKSGLCAVKLRVTYNRKSKYFSVRHYLKNNDWGFCSDQKELNKIRNTVKGAKKDIRLNYEGIERKASDLINEMTSFSFEQFESKFLNKISNWDYLENAFQEQIQELKSADRMGYASSFTSTLTAIKYYMEGKNYPRGVQGKDYAHFRKYKTLKFIDITPIWLSKFESFLNKNDKSTSTIGVYTRNIRVLFNRAIKEHNIKAEYPFEKYRPKTSSGSKRALTINQVNAIASYRAITGTHEQFAKDMFVFSFLANGINITDILRLKYKNINKEEIKFARFKTKVEVSVTLTPTLTKIIKRHGNIGLNENVYVFRILNGVEDEQNVFRLIRQKNKQINYHLKSIARKVGIDPELANKISTYFARHSYATISKNSGESIEYIKESLGHTSSATTEKYLDSFTVEHRKKASNKLEQQIVNI